MFNRQFDSSDLIVCTNFSNPLCTVRACVCNSNVENCDIFQFNFYAILCSSRVHFDDINNDDINGNYIKKKIKKIIIQPTDNKEKSIFRSDDYYDNDNLDKNVFQELNSENEIRLARLVCIFSSDQK